MSIYYVYRRVGFDKEYLDKRGEYIQSKTAITEIHHKWVAICIAQAINKTDPKNIVEVEDIDGKLVTL